MNRRSFLAVAASAPFALSSPAARARLLGGTPLALVTADLEAHVVAVHLTTGRILHRVPTEPGPRSIESVGGTTAVIAHTTRGAISFVDGPPLRDPAGPAFSVRGPVRGFSAPRYCAAHPAGRHAYVTDSGRGDVAVVDVVVGEVVERLDVGGPSRHLGLSPSGRSLWIALGSKAEELAVVDVRLAARPRLVGRVRPPFLAHDVVFAPDGRAVWVTSGDRGTIAVYGARDSRVRFRIAADAPPQHVAFAGGRAYVASGDDGTLRVHDAGDARLLKTTRIPVGSYNVQEALGSVVTPSLERGTLCVVRRDGLLEHEVRVARSSHDACFLMGR